MASSTMVMTSSHAHSLSYPQSTPCPSCGYALPPSDDALRRIHDLEAQVKLLNSKAAAAVDKLADYEDEVRFLRAANTRSQQNGGPPQDGQQTTRLASLGGLLMRRRNISGDANAGTLTGVPSINGNTPPQQSPPSPLPPLPGGSSTNAASMSSPALPLHSSSPSMSSPLTLTGLHNALETERQLRQRAETSLTQTQTDLFQTQSELEELTAQLFGQANEMVATERRERAKLEERVKVLEVREREKKGRLERLEDRVKRVERVRGMVG